MSQKLLTGLELKVMNLLWDKKKSVVKDLLEIWDEQPKPAYNTVSTVIRILEEKGFVGHEASGRTYVYFPLVSRKQYQKRALSSMVDNVFSGSLTGLVSTLVGSRKLSESELNELKALIEKSES